MIFKAILSTIAVLGTSIANLYAQNSDAAANAIRDAFRQADALARPIPEAEQKKAYEAASTILQRLVTFNEDGTAKTVHRLNGNQVHLEWTGLGLGQVSRRIVTDADRLNGITNRYAVTITATSHRRWDRAQNQWTEWLAVGYPLFPSTITLIERNGALEHSMVLHGDFGSGLPPAGSKIVPRPNNLPPGVTRSR